MQGESTATVSMGPVEAPSRCLADLAVGESGRIHRVSCDGPIRQRLLDMGVTRGAVVEVRRVAPLGDPLEISIKGYSLAIRRNEAESILLHRQAS